MTHIYDDPQFAELPPTKGRATWAPIVAKLQANPGRWACIAEVKHRGAASTLAASLKRWFPGLEATTRWEAGQPGKLWACWSERLDGDARG